ncbi:DUF3742 family protein [Pseudomonas sp. ABC1]|uniref:DUF3742 family protein n=1 Tax=Pseudomonas sp. ABC1 TaxID=2748080 RepID=UPI0015C39DD1|nr:DUF3742 family protein [Pseudomonas sp. ABC1]QLF92110.1 DUF3742 family protein [Pseudomonas sp. ABC1]
MNSTTRISTAERLGRTAGRRWRAYVRGERRVSHWLTSMGMPVPGATALVWAFKLTVLGMLLYAAFWLALLVLVFFVAGAVASSGLEWEEPETEWRTGPAGFGLYRGDIRVDVGDPYDDD